MSFHRRVVSAFRPVAVQERKVSRAVVFFFLLLLMNRKPDWDRDKNVVFEAFCCFSAKCS